MLYFTDCVEGSKIDRVTLARLYEERNVIVGYYADGTVYNLSGIYIAASGFPIVTHLDSFLARVWPFVFKASPKHHKLFDSTFVYKIMEEKEGILAWLVEGAKKYSQESNLARRTFIFSDFALNMSAEWKEEMRKKDYGREENKKPLPTRKGQTNTKNRQ
jgi:hypothetical protein